MTGLAQRVATYLADGHAATVPDIARALRVRDADVRGLLRADRRFERRPTPPGRTGQANCWGLTTQLVPCSGTSSAGLDGFKPRDTQGQASEAAEGLWRLTLAADAPHSVGEAIGAARRRAAA